MDPYNNEWYILDVYVLTSIGVDDVEHNEQLYLGSEISVPGFKM